MRWLASGFTALGLAAASLAIAVPAASAAGSLIETAAGTGFAGNTGDGGQAVAAQLVSPAGVAVDGVGNTYVADDGADVVRRISPTGVISTVAGTGVSGYSGDNGLATSAKLNGPTDVVLDAAGDLYIADDGNHVVREVVAATGKIRTVAGNGAVGYSGDGGPAKTAKLTSPVGLDIDTAGNVYIADYGNGTVRELLTSGDITTIAGTGVVGYAGDGGSATSAELSRPGDVAVVGSMVYIADGGNGRVRVVDGSGTISTVAGNGTLAYSGDGGAATAASLIFPTGLAADSAGNLFIADFSGQTIREVSAGTISTVAGTGTAGYSGDGAAATSAELNNPARVNLDPAGNLYVSDWSNHVLRKVDALGSAAVAPDAPTAVTATAGDGQAAVSWTAPTNTGGAAITSYTVTPNDGTTTLTPITVTAATTTTTVTGLTNTTAYTFTVTATNTAGTSTASTPSAPVTPAPAPPAVTAPDPPTAVTATAGDGQAAVSWTAPTNTGGAAITSYTVTPNDGTTTLTPITVTAATTTTTVTGLTNTTAYTFTVTATNTAGTSTASTPSAPVTPAAAGAPAGNGGNVATPVPPAPAPPAPASPTTAPQPPADPQPAGEQPTPPADTAPTTSTGHPSTHDGNAPLSKPTRSTPPAIHDPVATAAAPPVTPFAASPTHRPGHHRRTHHRGHRGDRATKPASTGPTAHHTQIAPSHRSTRTQRTAWQAVGAVLLATTKKTAIPAGLLLLIGLFLSVQNRMDRRDPKLALAPVYADPGVSFVPALS